MVWQFFSFNPEFLLDTICRSGKKHVKSPDRIIFLRHGLNKSGNNNSPVTARKGCNWKNKILIEFVTRAFPSCFDRKTLCSNQSNFALLLFLLSVHWTQSQSMQSLEDHSRKYEITTDIIVVYFTHCSRKINNMFIIDRNVTAFAQCQELIFHLFSKQDEVF